MFALAGCGGDSAASAENPTDAEQVGPADRTDAGERAGCPARVGAFLDSLDALRRRLAVGLSYDQYAAKVEKLGADYNRIPIGRLALDCLATTGTPAENAFNEYIDAANAWGECLADASCTLATIEPVLQRRWRVASHFLSEAR